MYQNIEHDYETKNENDYETKTYTESFNSFKLAGSVNNPLQNSLEAQTLSQIRTWWSQHQLYSPI